MKSSMFWVKINLFQICNIFAFTLVSKDTVFVDGFHTKNHVFFGQRNKLREKKISVKNTELFPEENKSVDSNRLSVSQVPYKSVLLGLKDLYPPQDLSKRNAISRSDGYWSYIKDGKEAPKHFTYGEFDFLFFCELLDRAHYYYFNGDNSTKGWEGKIFVDIGSGTGRLVIGAAALHPGLSKCKGLEILSGIHEVALKNLEKCKKNNEIVRNENISQISSLDSNEIDIVGSKAKGDGIFLDQLTSDKIKMQEFPHESTSELPQIQADKKNLDNRYVTETDVEGKMNYVEPLTSEMRKIQESLQQMTADEWRQILGDDTFFDDNYVSDEDDENLVTEDEYGNSTIFENNAEVDSAIEEVVDEKTSVYNARNISFEIHPGFCIPPEDDLIAMYEMEENYKIIEHKFESFEEFANLSIAELKLTLADIRIGERTVKLVDTQSKRDNNKKSRYCAKKGEDYMLCFPQPLTDGKLPLAPIEFYCGSFEDPYEYIGDADVAFVFSSCMDEDMVASLSHAFGRQCKPGTIIITTDYQLSLEGYVDPVADDLNLPSGKYKLELLEKIDGWCWITGGDSTAYIHRVVQSINVNGDTFKRPKLTPKEEAYRIVKAMEENKLSNTDQFLRVAQNSLAFHLNLE